MDLAPLAADGDSPVASVDETGQYFWPPHTAKRADLVPEVGEGWIASQFPAIESNATDANNMPKIQHILCHDWGRVKWVTTFPNTAE